MPGAWAWNGIRRGAACLLVAVLGTGVLLGASGCRAAGRPSNGVPDYPPPSFAEVAAIHNARVDELSSLWARTTVQVKGQDAQGRRFSEQAEGHLQIVPPNSVMLTFGKLGKTYFMLASNDERYWWFDMVDTDVRTGMFGRHELADLSKLEQMGIPVLPKDLMAVLNIQPWSTDVEDGGRTFWSSDGKYLGASMPAESGRRVVWMDPQSLQPQIVQLQTPDGEELVRANLTSERYVTVDAGSGTAPRIASNYAIHVSNSDVVVNLSLWDPEVKPISPAVFDFDRVVRMHRILSVRDLDADEQNPQLPPF